jgi:hypothetical protein
MRALNRHGIMLRYSGDGDSGLAANYYARVVDSQLLARRTPELKKMAGSLTGLAVF